MILQLLLIFALFRYPVFKVQERLRLASLAIDFDVNIDRRYLIRKSIALSKLNLSVRNELPLC